MDKLPRILFLAAVLGILLIVALLIRRRFLRRATHRGGSSSARGVKTRLHELSAVKVRRVSGPPSSTKASCAVRLV